MVWDGARARARARAWRDQPTHAGPPPDVTTTTPPVLPPPTPQDVKASLLRLLQELLFNFIELNDCLARRPDAYARTVEGVGAAARNVQHVLNALRPVQARLSLAAGLRREGRELEAAAREVGGGGGARGCRAGRRGGRGGRGAA